MSGADGTPVKPASVYLPPLDAVVMQMLHFNLDAGRQLLLYGLDGDLIEINRFAMWVILDGDISTVGSRTTIRIPIMLLGRDRIPLRVFGYEDSIDVD